MLTRSRKKFALSYKRAGKPVGGGDGGHSGALRPIPPATGCDAEAPRGAGVAEADMGSGPGTTGAARGVSPVLAGGIVLGGAQGAEPREDTPTGRPRPGRRGDAPGGGAQPSRVALRAVGGGGGDETESARRHDCRWRIARSGLQAEQPRSANYRPTLVGSMGRAGESRTKVVSVTELSGSCRARYHRPCLDLPGRSPAQRGV